MEKYKTNKEGDLFIPKKMVAMYGKLSLFLGMIIIGDKCVSKSQVRSVKKIFKEKLKPEDIKRIVLTRKSKKICDWCKSPCYILEEHHYPTKRSLGGKDIVSICGKCHSDYHYIENLKININKYI